MTDAAINIGTMLDSTGMSCIGMQLVANLDKITASAIGIEGKMLNDEGIMIQFDTEFNKDISPAASKWNMAIGKFKEKLGSFLLDLGKNSLLDKSDDFKKSNKEFFVDAVKELENFLYDKDANPYFEEGKEYSLEDLVPKELD